MDYWDRYPPEIAKVTPGKIQEIASKYMDIDHLQIVCVGDGHRIRGVLEKYAPVEASAGATGKKKTTVPSTGNIIH